MPSGELDFQRIAREAREFREQEKQRIAAEKEEEARTIKGKRPVRQPTREEYEEHMRTHLPFRKWCPHCVKGKRKNDPRRTDKEREISVNKPGALRVLFLFS